VEIYFSRKERSSNARDERNNYCMADQNRDWEAITKCKMPALADFINTKVERLKAKRTIKATKAQRSL
jgi:hypothetical protein